MGSLFQTEFLFEVKTRLRELHNSHTRCIQETTPVTIMKVLMRLLPKHTHSSVSTSFVSLSSYKEALEEHCLIESRDEAVPCSSFTPCIQAFQNRIDNTPLVYY